MKWFRFALIVVLAAVIQASAFLNTISLTDLHIKPDILLILLVYFAISCDRYDVIICSFSLGLAADVTGALIGPHFISFGIIGTALAHIKKVILVKKTSQQAITIFATGILTYLIAAILTKLKVSTADTGGLFEVFASSIYSAIFWFLIKWPVTTTGKWLGIGVHRFGISTEER
ncbi:MAG: rod shape-determining protein MreD [Phycisphaerae bacterium]|jgi:rod shape-determining protein MreD